MKNLPLFFGVLLGTLILVIGVAVLFTNKTNAPIDQTRVLGDQRNATGSATPKVTIVEFSDFQCPACLNAENTIRPLVASNPEQIRFVYRQFPLVSIHKNAFMAAEASELAASVGQFWPFHHVLFDNQPEWAELSTDEAQQKMVEYGTEVGIPAELMEEALNSNTFQDRVTADMTDGDALGVNSTPTFFVNGARTELSAMQQAVANALKE